MQALMARLKAVVHPEPEKKVAPPSSAEEMATARKAYRRADRQWSSGPLFAEGAMNVSPQAFAQKLVAFREDMDALQTQTSSLTGLEAATLQSQVSQLHQKVLATFKSISVTRGWGQ